VAERVEVIKRRDAYENDHTAFMLRWQAEDATLRDRILKARKSLKKLKTPDSALADLAELCIKLASDGLRGELTLLKAARAFAAWRDDTALARSHIRAVAPLALRHRLRRDPLDEAGSGARVMRVLEEVLP
jgi:magnesium chelatase subunit I